MPCENGEVVARGRNDMDEQHPLVTINVLMIGMDTKAFGSGCK